ncbi:ABC transporter permease [Chryseolinea lacunae]|uniref:Transport permease protein n=1 Tax=Chryseolinea lacunae TaxID=2801331 RepID=A0ABS1KXL3_9BACT|nr:ABC transporter permease [Chryseolinea lacunae]MBL0744038.1 ABC transporter permease [Chryseolinea lacunae]
MSDKVDQNSVSIVETKWDVVLSSNKGFFNIPWRDVLRYKDLLYMFVKRDVIVIYKQTILGPIWFFVQPILTTIVYIVVFGGIAGISTDGIPKALFYSSGIIIWNYFSESLTLTSKTFLENANIFGKVYFPRIIVPIAKVTSGLLKFLVQFLFFLVVLAVYVLKGTEIHVSYHIVFVPFLLICIALLGMGLGIIFTSLTTKYRDLNFLIQFGVSLMMYATPVIYPLSSVPQKYKGLILMNPVTHLVEGFRFAFTGSGVWSWGGLGYTGLVTVIVLSLGILIFSKVENTFMDTV